MKKKCKVVLLPTEGKSRIFEDLKDSNKLEFYQADQHASSAGPKYHLYILSDDEIKEGDWYLIYLRNEWSLHNELPKGGLRKECLGETVGKIIATTDTSLKLLIGAEESTSDNMDEPILVYQQLPQPSQDFINVFIEEYNKGNIINDVLVEYEINTDFEYQYDVVLKIDKNNTISINKVKDSWNRDEVIEILHKHLDDSTTGHKQLHKILENQLDEWIKENL